MASSQGNKTGGRSSIPFTNDCNAFDCPDGTLVTAVAALPVERRRPRGPIAERCSGSVHPGGPTTTRLRRRARAPPLAADLISFIGVEFLDAYDRVQRIRAAKAERAHA